MNSTMCTHEYINAHYEQACEIARACDYNYINFFAMHYCTFDGRLWLTLPVLAIVIFICFFLLSDTSNKYLSNALTLLSDKLKMSQNLAAVTFLALGNGAPDVISSFVAGDEDGGIEFSVGALIGAGTFVTCIVLSSVVLFAGQVQVSRSLFIRDIVIYFMALAFLLTFSIQGRIYIWQSILFFLLYIA